MSFGGMKGMDLRMVPYGGDIKPESESHDVVEVKPVEKTREPPVEPVVMNPKPTSKVKYRECLRNHAASLGGHANDGCGEFMPASGDPLTCAACSCHRNFHRKEIVGPRRPGDYHHQLPPPPAMLVYSPASDKKMGGFTTVVPSLTLPQPSPYPATHRNGGAVFGDVDHHNDTEKHCDRRSETPERGEVAVELGASTTATTRNKRFRTKFTQEQKDKMLEFAEKLSWRIQKQDDVALNKFCSELGIKRNVLKVWMHNNKNAHRRREAAPTPPPPPPPPPSPPPAPPQHSAV